MKKRKHITIYVKTLSDSSGFDYTNVSTYNKDLADIYFLEEADGFRYCVEGLNGFYEETFEKEIDAIRFIVKEKGLDKVYENIRLKLGYYSNSEVGAITYKDDIENINLAL